MTGPLPAAVTTASDAQLPDGGPPLDVDDLFRRHTPDLLRYLARRVHPAVADDLVSATFEVVLAAPERFDPARGTPRGWLYGIATHVLLGHLRTTGRARAATARLAAASPDIADDTVDVVAQVDAARRVGRLAGAIDDLAPDEREVLLLTAWTDLSAAEIGTALGVPAGTVRSRLHRARAAVRAADVPSVPTEETL